MMRRRLRRRALPPIPYLHSLSSLLASVMTLAGTPIGIFGPTLHCVGCLSTASGRESLGTAEVELSSPSATPGLRCFTHPYLSCYKKEAPREMEGVFCLRFGFFYAGVPHTSNRVAGWGV